MRRQRTALLPALGFFLLLGAASLPAADASVLLVTVDTLRPDRLSCYSDKYLRTPQVDALAARGAVFERAFAHVPVTLPSHVNILLGLTSLAHGVDDNGQVIIPREFVSLAEVLKAAGYATGAFVSAFPLDSRFGLNQGFDVYDDRYPARPAAALDFPERPAEKTIALAVEWLSRQAGPWFCWIHLFDPHSPYAPPEPYASRFPSDRYSGEVAYVDDALAKLFAAVEARGGPGRTLIVLTSDHGESLGEHGEGTHSYFAYNSTLWVPLLIAGPGVKPARVKDVVSHVDIFPTVCDLLGLEEPAALQGESLRPLLEGKAVPPRPVYFEAMEGWLHRGAAPLRGLIDGGRKYFDSPIPELYDLGTDFDERTNLAGRANLAPFAKRLAEKMKLDASPLRSLAVRKTDRETREKLRSLGYASAPAVPPKKAYGPEDDVKTLLPFEQKLVEASQLFIDKKPGDSARLLEDLIRANKNYTRAYAQLAELYHWLGRKDAALLTLKRGADASPGDFMIVSAYGIALVEQGWLDEGIEVLGRALALFDGDPSVWDSLAEGHWKKDDFEKAEECFRSALVLAPADAAINGNIGNFYVARGLKTRNSDFIDWSFVYFRTALETDPSLASVHNGLGGAWKIRGNLDEAVRSFEKAAELDPSYDLPVYNLALAHLDRGEKDRALAYAQKYLALKGTALTADERRDVEALIEKCKK